MINPDMQGYVELYLEEGRELLSKLKTSLETLREKPCDDEGLTVAGRSVHTFASSSGTLGLEKMLKLGRAMEYYIDDAKAKKTGITRENADLLLRCHKLFEEFLSALAGNSSAEEPDVSQCVSEIEKLGG